MNLKIVSLENFSRDVKKLFKKYKNISKDLKKLQDTLLKDPKSGIELGENLYKIRLANSSIPTGKSVGFRVVYYYVDQQENIYLLTIYSKRELENISDERLVEILKINGLG
jgi:mRNA-degrading endonuclease RelE of RelBE toxin-antitoxin system